MKEKEIREKLEQALRQTEKQISRYKDLAGPVSPDNAIGRVSRMDAINHKSVVDAALRKAEAKKTGLERHLDQLGSPAFGQCPGCKQEIPIQRILLAPESAFCVNCAR